MAERKPQTRRIFTAEECASIRESYHAPGGHFGTYDALARLWKVSAATIQKVVGGTYRNLEEREAKAAAVRARLGQPQEKGARSWKPVMAADPVGDAIDARDARIAELERENDALRAELAHVREIRGEAETQMERLMHPDRDGVVRVDGVEWRGK